MVDTRVGAPDTVVVDRVASRSQRRSRIAASTQGLLTPAIFLLIFLVYGSWLGSRFLSVDLRLLDVHQNVPVLILGLAALVTLIIGQFDLSVASMASLSTTLTVYLVIHVRMSLGPVIAICLLIGCLGGLLNGLLVARFKINTFIATLGTGGAFLGASEVISGGGQLAPAPGGPRLPNWFTGHPSSFGNFSAAVPGWLAWGAFALLCACVATSVGAHLSDIPRLTGRGGYYLSFVGTTAVVTMLLPVGLPHVVTGISLTIAFLLLVTLVLWALIERTPYGRCARAIGSNPQASRLAGVAVERTGIVAFTVGGVVSSCAGVVLAAAQGDAAPNGAGPFLLPAFTAAFLSSVVFSRGRFTVIGTVIGGSFLIWVSQGLVVGGVPYTWTDIIDGLVLVASVGLSLALRRLHGSRPGD